MGTIGKLMRVALPLLILAAAVTIFMMLRATRPEAAPIQIQERAWRVNVESVEPGRYAPDLVLYGTVEAPRRADLSAAVTADVLQVLTAEGRIVKADDTLVVLDDRDVYISLRQRLADLAEIEAMIDSEHNRYESDLLALEKEETMLELDRKALTRATDLSRRNLGSRSLEDEARLALERQALAVNTRQQAVDDHPTRLAQLEARRARAEALLDQARLDYQRTRIKAPFSGRVARVPVAVGDRVRVGDLLVDLYATDDLEIRAQTPFRYLPQIRASLEQNTPLAASAHVDGRMVQARLDRLSGETASGGGLDALFTIERGSELLVPGRLLSLIVELPPQEGAVALPFGALYGLNRIYRLQDGRMAGLAVERIGERRDAEDEVRVLVRSPQIKAGDQIITTQLPNAVEGLKVTVTAERKQ